MIYLTAFICVALTGTLRFEFPASVTPVNFRHQSPPGVIQKTTTSTHKRVVAGSKRACVPLNAEKPAKGVLSSLHAACFTMEVLPGEAAQLLVDQPEDLEIHFSGGADDRLVDGFDIGVETLTITSPGIYRAEIRKVEHSSSTLTFSIVLWKMEIQKASAWQQAETWATTSKKKSRKIEEVNRSLTLWEGLGDASSIARTYLKRGSTLQSADQVMARAAFEKALELCRSSFDLRCSAEAENNSGAISNRLGDVDQASQRLEEAARDWQTLADLPNLGKTRSNLGLLLRQTGDFIGAIRSLDEAAQVLRGRDPVAHARVLNNLGLCYQSLAEYGKARANFEGAVSGFAGAKNLHDLVRARMNLGRNYMLEGHLRRAQPILERAAAEAEKLNDLQARADTLRNLGQNLWRTGKADQARSRLELALEVDRSDSDRRGQSSALHYLGLIAQERGDVATARNLLTEAVQLRREAGLRDDAAESLSVLASLEFHVKNLGAAHDYAEQALKLLESVRTQTPNAAARADYYSRKRQFFDLLVDLAMTTGKPGAATDGLLAAERGRGRALIDLLSEGLLPGQLPPEEIQQRASIQRRLAYWLRSSIGNPSLEKEAKIEQLLSEEDLIETRIHKSIAGQKLAQPLNSVEQLQHEYLPSGSALLEYYLGERQSYLWLVDSQRVEVFTLPRASTIEADAVPVVEGLGQWHERQRSPQKEAVFQRALRKLSTILLGQLGDIELPPQIILVPDGVLHRVPFAALWLPKAGTQLGLSHDLVQVPSAAYLMAGKKPRNLAAFPQTILAIADPVFSEDDPRVTSDHRKARSSPPGPQLSRLFFDRDIRTIESLVPRARRRTLRGFEASLSELDRLRLEDFGVLHFSTHALIDDRIPERSWIALSMVDRAGRPRDGILLPQQLARLHLAGSVVVLSACNTALSRQVLGEGLVGLSSSLLYAGGSQLVLTLTEIDAEGSSYFLSDVYRRFLSGRNSMEHSLTLARRAMARSRRFSDPYFWASFIVIGRPADTVNSGLASTYNRR